MSTQTVLSLQDPFQTGVLQDQPAEPGLLKPFAQARFDVYRNAYRARLRGALRDNYEVLSRVMGDDDAPWCLLRLRQSRA